MTVSIIIPTFNRRQILQGLLTALTHDERSKQALDFEIIVVDDRSSDGTWDMVSTQFPTVKLLRGPGKNPEAAKRIAIENSTGDYLVALDDDSMPRAGWLAEVKAALERGEKIVQAKLVFLDLGQQDIQNEEDRRLFRTGFRFDMMPVTLLSGGFRPQYLKNCIECGCFISRDVLARIPFDDPNLIGDKFGTPASFSIRVSSQGLRIFFEPSCGIDHLGALAGGCVERSGKKHTKQECSDYTAIVVHNIMVLTRMHQPWRIPILIPYYLAGGCYLSIRQRKNCVKYFFRGLLTGITTRLQPLHPYANLS